MGQEDDTCAFVLLQIRDTIVPSGSQPDSVSQAHLSGLKLSNSEMEPLNMSQVCVEFVHQRLP